MTFSSGFLDVACHFQGPAMLSHVISASVLWRVSLCCVGGWMPCSVGPLISSRTCGLFHGHLRACVDSAAVSMCGCVSVGAPVFCSLGCTHLMPGTLEQLGNKVSWWRFQFRKRFLPHGEHWVANRVSTPGEPSGYFRSCRVCKCACKEYANHCCVGSSVSGDPETETQFWELLSSFDLVL